MATYLDYYNAGTDPTFINRTRMAGYATALAVSSESPAADYHEQRVGYATLFLRVSETEAPKLALAIIGTAGIQGNVNTGDGNITAAVSSVWNAFAGVVTQP